MPLLRRHLSGQSWAQKPPRPARRHITDKDKLPEGNHTIYIQTELDGKLSEMVELAKLVISGENRLSTTWLVIIIIAIIVVIGILILLLLYVRKKKDKKAKT